MSAVADARAGVDDAGPLGDTGLWVDVRGTGPAVLLLAGLGDPAEAWEFQLDAFSGERTVIAFDNRGVGRSPLPPEGISIASMADDAALVLDQLGLASADVIGFSGGSVVAQELAIRHPERVDSLVLVGTWARPDEYFTRAIWAWRWIAAAAPDARSFLEAFFLWVYTARAHADGFVDAVIDAALDFPFPQSTEAFLAQIDAFTEHDALDRLGAIDAPTLVVTGAEDLICPPRLGSEVATAIPGARFVVMPGEAHQPFQESPDAFNTLVRDFWQQLGGPPTLGTGSQVGDADA